MSRQVSPETTRWNVLQFHTIPGCVSVGVTTPLPRVVVLVFMGGARGSRVAYHAHTDVRIRPKSRAIRLDLRIPSIKVADANAVEVCNLLADLAGIDLVELVAVGNHPGLGRLRRGDAVARSTGRICCGGGLDWHAKVALYTVRVAQDQGARGASYRVLNHVLVFELDTALELGCQRRSSTHIGGKVGDAHGPGICNGKACMSRGHHNPPAAVRDSAWVGSSRGRLKIGRTERQSCQQQDKNIDDLHHFVVGSWTERTEMTGMFKDCEVIILRLR